MCTDFLEIDENAWFVNGRSMELETELRSKLFFRSTGNHYKHEFLGFDNGIRRTAMVGAGRRPQ